ncbi:hypothetical protein HPB52_001650 [Rhipicephalus sanguineus]|uniref:Gustatory receptor n=1 Tax=Rhipicephalus sanguineus TaxID=34632 RepID=A0A9D4Q410_RHISA|nr:hypothetical protein HPB52_001650 [Rhipicephalus sanguineus]
MLYAYSYSVVLLCTAAYYTIIPDLQFRARLFFLTFGVLHWLSILLPVFEVHRMKCAVTKLPAAIQQIPMANYSEEMFAQLRMLVMTIKPTDLKYSACDFFEIDLSTSAQILGAVITYTVLLVQTNQKYLTDSVEHCANVTVM